MELIFFPIHILTLLFLLWTIVLADHVGFKWITGKTPRIDEKRVATYHKRTWIGLCIMITTGLGLFWPEHSYLLARPQFWVKMAFVVTLICNGFVINHLMKTAVRQSFKELSVKQKAPFLISGAISSLSWLGAITGAFYLDGE